MERIEAHGYLRKVLGPGEEVLFVTRQHGLFLFGSIFLWLLAVVVILGGVGVVSASSGNPNVMVGAVLALLHPIVLC